MMNAGVGLILGTGPARKPASFSYVPDAKGRCPNYNDGFRVTADESRAMAMAAAGLVRVERWVAEEWNKLSEAERADAERYEFYKKPVRADFIDKTQAFAEWALKSGGFSIW
jgi:hypothetical protein